MIKYQNESLSEVIVLIRYLITKTIQNVLCNFMVILMINISVLLWTLDYFITLKKDSNALYFQSILVQMQRLWESLSLMKVLLCEFDQVSAKLQSYIVISWTYLCITCNKVTLLHITHLPIWITLNSPNIVCVGFWNLCHHMYTNYEIYLLIRYNTDKHDTV